MTFFSWYTDGISIGTRHMSGGSSWRTVVGLGFIWPAILTVGIQFMPESPRWLASRGRLDEAQHALARARGVNSSETDASYYLRREAEEIRASVEYERSVRGGWLDCFRVENKTLYRTILGVYFPFGVSIETDCHLPRAGMSLQSLQQLTGANYFFYYGATIFASVGISDSFVTQIILGSVNFVCTFGGLYVMEKVFIIRDTRTFCC